ncbi:hypothetical protein PROVRETT_09481 [Providencia rettgeri DSM 1131]|nr:hypothetical protein PROVRETT_09481 [Providencia rettgeri DSM 1131]
MRPAFMCVRIHPLFSVNFRRFMWGGQRCHQGYNKFPYLEKSK